MKLAVSAVITILVLAMFTVAAPAQKPAAAQVVKPAPKLDISLSIVRLHNLAGEFFCSGVVVGKRTVITAAHCVANDPGMIEIRDAHGKRSGTFVTVAGVSPRADYAILRGNVRRFAALQTEVTPIGILKDITSNSRQIISCGFPWSGELFCAAVTNRVMFNFSIAGTGYLYPGMSGGPVIDLTTGKVIAVNTAVNGTVVILSPIIEIYRSTGVSPE